MGKNWRKCLPARPIEDRKRDKKYVIWKMANGVKEKPIGHAYAPNKAMAQSIAENFFTKWIFGFDVIV